MTAAAPGFLTITPSGTFAPDRRLAPTTGDGPPGPGPNAPEPPDPAPKGETASDDTATGDVVLLWILAMYFALRPPLDALTTFAIGPDLKGPVGLGLLAVTGTAVAAMSRRDGSDWSSHYLAALALAGAAALSSLGAAHFANSFALSLRVLAAALVFIAVADLASRQGTKAAVALYAAIIVGFAAAGAVAVAQLFGLAPQPPTARFIDSRPTGPFSAPTVLGTSMFIAAIVAAAAAPALRHRRWLAIGATAVAATFTVVLLANNSRGPFIAAALAMIVLAGRHRRWDLIVVAAAASVAVLALTPELTARVAQLGDSELLTGRSTLTFRFNVWRQALPRFFDSPVVGIGMGEVQQTTTLRAPPHNTTVQALVEAGVLGLVAHMGLIVGLGVALWRRRGGRTGLHRSAVDAAMAVGVGYAALSLSENLMTQLVTTGPVAAVIGIGVGLRANAPR